MDSTTVLIFSCLASAIITYGLGLFVYFKNPGSSVNRLFLLSMLAAAYWAFGEFMMWQSAGEDAVRFWLKASAFWTIAIVLTFHFILAFTRHPLAERHNLRLLVVFLYLPALLISMLLIFTDLLYGVVPVYGERYIYVPMTDSPAYIASSVFFVIIMVVALYIGFTSWMRQEPGRLRAQNLLVCTGIVIVVVTGSFSAFVLPAGGIHVPNTVFIGIVCFSGIISYAMIRKGLFTITPESAAANIIQLMPDGLILADRAGRIITINASAEDLFRKKRDELVGRPVESLLPRQSSKAMRASIREQGMVLDLEVVLETPEYRVVSIAGSLIKDPDGESAGVVLIVHDITGQKISERTLRLAKEKLSLLSQLTRHDITNQMTALSAYVLLLSEKTADPESRQYIDACTGILEKISDHLRFSREYEEIGKHDPAWQSAAKITEQAKSHLPPTGVTVESGVLPYQIFADPLTVKVVYNLLENALRHGGDKISRIRVSADERDGGMLVLSFEDDGTGVPDDEKELIFRHGHGKNTGLGLTLSREILSVTDIRLVETGTYGGGARFEMQIPPQSWRKG